ncbi:NLR family CARD domain-containing protein 4-like [Ptychodera flava]|uniref:NLR family CARD domain-containing protein 4-like n=1 Tax=Ptychodera flava TaxID=63121 RepID=UPI00396A0DF2
MRINVQGDGNVVVVTGDASSVKIGDIRLDSGESFDSVDFSNGHNNSGVGEAESASAKSCAKLLRAHYLNSSSKIHPTPWFEAGFQLRTTDIYTELEVTSRTERGVESSSSESDFRKRLVSGRCNRILVEGEPGVGKSTFCRKFTLDWATDDLEWAGNFDLLFTLNLRQVTRSGKLIDAIFDQLLPEDTDVDKGHLEHFIKKNQDKVLIFLDGVDELESTWKSDVLKLVKRRFLPQATVVATSRSTERHHLVTDIDGHYIIKGFTLDSVSSYIQKYFESDEGAAESLISMIEADDNIQILTTNPLNAVLLCVLWEDSERALWGNKVTELYRQIIVSIIKRFLKKMTHPCHSVKKFLEISNQSYQSWVKWRLMA